MNKQVEQIRAEVERLMNELIQEKEKGFGSDIDDACILELQNVLTFIDSMGENRPEPISPADVGFEALGRFWDEEVKKDSGELGHSVTKKSDQEEPVSEDLEKELEQYFVNNHMQVGEDNRVMWAGSFCPNLITDFRNIARHFADWQKKQMMKTAKLDGWIARDENGSLHIFELKPRRLEYSHQWWDRDYRRDIINESIFPDLRWEDEPIYVKLIIINEDKLRKILMSVCLEVDEFDSRLNQLLKDFSYLPQEDVAECLSFYLEVIRKKTKEK